MAGTSQPNLTATELQHKRAKQQLHTQLLKYTELNLIKLKPGSGVFYAIWPGNASGLLYSFWGRHRAQPW